MHLCALPGVAALRPLLFNQPHFFKDHYRSRTTIPHPPLIPWWARARHAAGGPPGGVPRGVCLEQTGLLRTFGPLRTLVPLERRGRWRVGLRRGCHVVPVFALKVCLGQWRPGSFGKAGARGGGFGLSRVFPVYATVLHHRVLPLCLPTGSSGRHAWRVPCWCSRACVLRGCLVSHVVPVFAHPWRRAWLNCHIVDQHCIRHRPTGSSGGCLGWWAVLGIK